MSTTRLLIIVLILLNALAFAGVKGWIVGTPPRTEPERITNQLNPERIRLSGAAERAGAASASSPATTPEVSATPAPASPPNAAPETTPEEPDSTPRTEPADEPAPHPEAQEVATSGESLPTPQPPALVCQAWTGLSEQEADALARRLRQAGVEAERRRSETPSAWWVRVPPQGSRDQAERRVQELRELGVKDMFIVQEAGQSQYAISLGLFKTEARAQQLLGQLRARGVRNAGVEARMSTIYLIQARLADESVRAIEADVRGISGRRTACNGR
jgi:cell division septation protein DedD